MKRSTLLFGTVLASLLAAGGNVRAAFIDAAWHYDWLATPPEITIDAATNTKITLTNEPSLGRVGGSNTVATNIITTSNSNTPISFSNLAYSLQLRITDDQTAGPNNFVILAFAGTLSGSISAHGSLMTNVFTPGVQKFGPFPIGLNTYSVTLDAFVAPSGPGAGNKGAIGATIIAVGHEGPTPPHNDTPEPGTMLLSCLGLSFLGAASWRKLRGQPAAS